MASWARELDVARAAASDAASVLRSHFRSGSEAWEKAKDDPLTAADLEANACIEAALAAGFPEDALLSEESGEDPRRAGARRVWIVDPMDGTRAFVEGRPEFAVAIALVEDGRPVVAVVHQPVLDVAVWAAAGRGTHRDRERVRVTAQTRLGDALLLASPRERARGELDAWTPRMGRVRTTSSIAWKLALVACGEADLNLTTRSKHEWDVCAGDLLVHEAGGRYAGEGLQPPTYNRPVPEIPGPLAAGNADLLRELFGSQ